MPFGLKNAPATFQRLMNSVLTGLQGLRCLIYLDDIVIFARDLQDHTVKLREIFDRLQKYHLKIKPSKCEFLRKEVVYLGHRISEQGVQPDENKMEAVLKFPIPKCPKDIKSFLGLVGYYRKFIKDFSKKALPLTSLLKKNVIFKWSVVQQDAFETLKNHLLEKTILQFPDFECPFNITTDASNYAIGAILSQGEYPNDLPIAYASRSLNSAEINYSTIEKELLAVVWAVKHFRPYVYGRKFRVITDHQPLVWLFSIKDPNSRLVRWRLKLEEYDYETIYKPGRKNSNADCLSRYLPDKAILNIDKSLSNNKSNNNVINLDSKRNKRKFNIIKKNLNDFINKISSGNLKIYNNNQIIESYDSIMSWNYPLVIMMTKDLITLNDESKSLVKVFNHTDLLRKENLNIGEVYSYKENIRFVLYSIINENLENIGKGNYYLIFKGIHPKK